MPVGRISLPQFPELMALLRNHIKRRQLAKARTVFSIPDYGSLSNWGNDQIREAFTAMGLDTALLSCHNFRRGCTSVLVKIKVPDRVIK